MRSTPVVFALVVLMLATFPLAGQEMHHRFVVNGYQYHDDAATSFVSLNWLYGVDNAISGVQLNLSSGIVNKDVTGWQGSLVSSYAQNSTSGLQSSLFFNYGGKLTGLSFAPFGIAWVKGDLVGLELAGIAAVSEGPTRIGQAAPVAVSMGHLSYVQLAGVAWAGGFTGLQASLATSISSGKSTGIQLSGVNVALAGIDVAQLAFAANWSGGLMRGVQASIGGNWAQAINGVQLGAVNASNQFTGVQFGLINYATRGTGVQIGLINISQELEGLPIGFLDIQANGENHVQYWLEPTPSNLFGDLINSIGIKLGSKYIYRIIAASTTFGYTEDPGKIPLYAVSLHWGFRIPLVQNSFAINLDFGGQLGNPTPVITVNDQDRIEDYFTPLARVFAELKFNQNFGLIGGFSWRFYFENWNSRFLPMRSFHMIDTPWFDMYAHGRFFLGLQI